MFGRSSGSDPVTEENCEALYRLSSNGEDVHVHRVHKITRKQVHLEKTAEDGTLLDPDGDPEGHVRLSRQELEHRGSVLHTPTRTRFYRDREEAQEV